MTSMFLKVASYQNRGDVWAEQVELGLKEASCPNSYLKMTWINEDLHRHEVQFVLATVISLVWVLSFEFVAVLIFTRSLLTHYT